MTLPSWRNTRGGRVATAMVSGAGVRVMSAVVSLLALPLAVRYLGAARYGVWATVTSTVVFLNLLDFGIAATLTNHIARSAANGDREYAARYFTNALALTVSLATAAGVAITVFWPRLDWQRLFHAGPGISPTELNSTIAAAVALVLLGLPASLAGRLLSGYQEVHRMNAAVAMGAAANLAGLLFGISLRVSLPLLFLLANAWTTLANVAALLVVAVFERPWLRPRWRWLDFAVARDLLHAGSGFFLIQMAAAVVFSSDNLVLSHYLGPAEVTPYSVTWRLVGIGTLFPALLFPALWPALADAYARGDRSWMKRAFLAALRATFLLNLIFALALLLVGQVAIHWWAGPSAVPSLPLLAMMAVWAVISGGMTVESCLLAAVNRTREQGMLSVLAAAVNLALSIYLVQRIGAVGVIAGTVLSYLLVLVVPQSLLVRRVLHPASESAPLPCAVAQPFVPLR